MLCVAGYGSNLVGVKFLISKLRDASSQHQPTLPPSPTFPPIISLRDSGHGQERSPINRPQKPWITRYSHLFCQKKHFLEFSMRRSDKSSKGHGADQPAKCNGLHSSKSTFCLTRYPSLGPVLNYALASLNLITRSTRPYYAPSIQLAAAASPRSARTYFFRR